jgi:hypothetical protein
LIPHGALPPCSTRRGGSLPRLDTKRLILGDWGSLLTIAIFGVLFKQRIALRKIAPEAIYKEISKLDPASNYWTVIVLGEASEARQLVYDCTPAAMEHLISVAPADFYIGDKKYQWLVYFNMNREHNEVSLIKSRDCPTPFDSLDSVS